MITELTVEALEYGRITAQAFEAAGGDELVQHAEAGPDRRADLVGPVLDELGAWDLDVRASIDELEAGAALCRSAGYWAVPHPVAERLARSRGADADGLVVVADRRGAARLDGLDHLRWVAVHLDGRRDRVAIRPPIEEPRKTAFVAELDLEPLDRGGAGDVALGLVLPCWTLLGMLDRAMELTQQYVTEREQFGRPLSAFQAVQFQLTDAEVERVGVEELAKYALWSIESARPEAVDDALGLRLAAIEAADVVFRIAHQLHGAIGFCDETAISWLSRHSQPLRRLPFGSSATRDALTTAIGTRGLTGLFPGPSA